MTKGLKNVITVCLVAGIISIILVELLFFFIFPSGWLFFLIPVIMGWSLKKYAKFPRVELANEEAFEKLRTRTGIICAAIVLISVLISVLPVIILGGIEALIANIAFYAVCVVAIYAGYSRGVGVITDEYYDSLND